MYEYVYARISTQMRTHATERKIEANEVKKNYSRTRNPTPRKHILVHQRDVCAMCIGMR